MRSGVGVLVNDGAGSVRPTMMTFEELTGH
jgi:hypothetical protein